MIKKKYIVSGTFNEYEEFLYKHRNDSSNIHYIYVYSPRDLRGQVNIEGFYIGTYYKRHDIEAIKEIIRTSKMKYVPAENAVYGNVTAFKRNANDYQFMADNSMIDSMRDRD